jgi:ribosomal protein L11 methyltransferase
MPWIEVSLSVSRESAAAAETALEQLGALAITLEDDADKPVLEPGPGETPLWPDVQLRGLFETGTPRQEIIDGLRLIPEVGKGGNIQWREVADQDWERAWLERFQPMKFGERLWIVPSGMEVAHDADEIQIRLDPGLAFGTGTHPTTALCLEWLDQRQIAGERVLDYGCGSGILGIAAAMKGASEVNCVDIDPQALEATVENAARNGVAQRVACCSPKDFAGGEMDVVLANILAAPLIGLAPVLAGIVRPSGALVLSGLLQEQEEQVAAAYRDDFELLGSKSLDGWLRMDFHKV